MGPLLELLTVGAVTAPLWTVFLWGTRAYRFLFALVVLVQAPVAVVGFYPPPSAALHLLVLAGGLLISVLSIFLIRPSTKAPVHVPARG
ncbi:hypothetical protein Val02_45760 [Virgisporangium aliadipatigenens]|uniref:Uncharacterized protein n=1 Tax=Virgisporangium aliadipatigenens TaxID=741659 RepID=A0A8J3YPL1_9ACTN|nr:hypothetical protein [Virgisporangium aliadipatigenens]GIJ47690.1 hypothetical protein Val02_45760 [Virgisporangium aliadipatigenens]